MTLWTAKEAEAATGGRAHGDWSVNGISIDTRTITRGDLFVALKAARDGHDFVAQALKKGAGAALVSYVPDGLSAGAPLLIVDDVQTGLEALGAAARARTNAKVVAVTGSVGKTSTKEMLVSMLADQGRTHAAVSSYNNHWGVPLTLARMPRDTEFAVVEVGMNHPGEIAPLVRQARPHVAMVTTVAPVHVEAFADVEGIAREKAAIMEGLEPGGVAILNADLNETPVLVSAADRLGVRARWFGTTSDEYHLGDVILSGEKTCAAVSCKGASKTLSIQSLGAHFAMNALGALAAVDALGADLDQAIQNLASWSPVQGRGARLSIPVAGGAITVLDDSYNANPTSVGAALAVLVATPTAGRRIACLGDMGELGEEAEALHAGLAAYDTMSGVDAVYSVGPLMRNLHQALPQGHAGKWFETSTEAAAALMQDLSSGDILLVKGSNYMQLVRVVDALREMGQGN
ncbi:MAG: UDP-N-acetylmuramoyl-tripeptide--D-alanyl-D-alanine ligase [Epibacterium sp.]|nr:UDP-N-acetylmuramoyl-tripeptide--D-alanyl-D-alanine ligase [Epibacterium sp.]NQX72220.1 UDP-N-acetylmuramoyl-tripeptide--D-alanyl-D-alanine ligase [Epibacterium sp.]